MEKKININYNGIDVIKVVMAILVIAIHTNPIEIIEKNYICNAYKTILQIAVPFFFISSAYLLFVKMNGDYNNESNINKIDKFIIKFINLYIIWSILYIPLAIYGYVQEDKGIFTAIVLYIRDFFLRGEHFYSWPLWYLLSAIYAMSLIRFLIKKKFKDYYILIFSIIIFVISQIITYLSYLETSGILYYVSKIIKLTIKDGRILTGISYMSIGMYIAKNKININWKILLFVSVTAFIINILKPNFITLLILSVGIFLLVLSLRLNDREIYYYFRKMSTIMYFTHMFFFFILGLIMGMNNNSGIIGFLFTLIGTVILSFIIIRLQMKKNNKILKMLFN